MCQKLILKAKGKEASVLRTSAPQSTEMGVSSFVNYLLRAPVVN